MKGSITMNNTNIIDMRDPAPKSKRTRKPKSDKRIAIENVLGIFLLFFIFEILAAMVLVPLTGISRFAGHEICMATLAAVSMLLAYTTSREKITERIRIKKLDLFTVLALTVGGFAFGEVIDMVSGSVLSHFMSVTEYTGVTSGLTGIISSVVCAPLFEEIICRFGFFGIMKKSFRAPFVIGFSSIIFAAFHLYNVQGFLNVAVQAVLMAIVYQYTKNLLIVMLEHSAHNAICEFCNFDGVYHVDNGFVLCSLPWLLLNIVLTVLCVIWFVKYFKPRYIAENKGIVNG